MDITATNNVPVQVMVPYRIPTFLNLAGAILVCSGGADGSQSVSYQILAKSGEPAPGTDLAFYSFEDPPSINSQGKVIFPARVGVVTPGLWSSAGGNLVKVACVGDSVPELPGVTLSSVDLQYIIAKDGGILFKARLAGEPSNTNAAWFLGHPDSGFSIAARSGTAAPGTGGNFGNDLSQISLREGLEAGFLGRTSNDIFGVWRGSVGNLSLPISTGTSSSAGVIARVDYFGFFPGGDLYSVAHTATCGLYRITGQGISKKYAQGDAAPGVTGGTFSTHPSNGHLQLIGCFTPDTVAYSGLVVSGASQNGVYYAETAGALRIVATAGQPITGHGNFGYFFVDPHFASDGSMLGTVGLQVGGSVTSANDSILCYWPPGGVQGDVRVILREGMQAPGLPGVTFAGFFGDESAINGNGYVIAYMRLAGSGITSSNDETLWSWNAATGELRLLCREGQPMDFGDGVLRAPTVSPRFRGGKGETAGFCNGLSDSNEFTFRVSDPDFRYYILKGKIVEPPPFQARIETDSSSGLRIFFPSEDGANYQVESSDSLGPLWVPFGVPVEGTGGEIGIPLGAPAPPRNFFRIRKLAP